MKLNPKYFTPYDSAEFIKTDSARILYMNEALATGDPEFIAHAVGVIARSRGMTEVAKQAEVSRASLYKSLSGKGNPEFATVLKLMAVLGLKLCVKPDGLAKKKAATKTTAKTPAKALAKTPAKTPAKRQKEMASATA